MESAANVEEYYTIICQRNMYDEAGEILWQC